MDHLPHPIDHTGHDRVAFFAPLLSSRKVYKPEDFFVIPSEDYQHEDFQKLLEEGIHKRLDAGRANAFLQSWLWFALLAQVLDTEIYRDDFHRKSDNTLSTVKLNDFLLAWIKREKAESEISETHDRTRTSKYVRASMALESARRFISKHCAHERMDRDDRPRRPQIAECPYTDCKMDKRFDEKLTLSLAVLGEILQTERPRIPSGLDDRLQFYNKPNVQEKNWGYSNYSRSMLLGNNWCPYDIRRMESTFSGVTSAYFMSRMKPPEPKADHSSCTPFKCNSEHVEQSALHMNGCTGKNCKTENIDETSMVECISQGKTPLITLTDAKGMEFSQHDLTQDDVVPFVALSHTWEDGLVESGKDARNKNDRCMFRCQLEKLQSTCNALVNEKGGAKTSQQVYLWIDVLCLPRDSSVRGVAIDQMKNIYAKAEAVLVWERYMLQKKKTVRGIEMNVRIRMSGWAQRLWTLQEAVLAKDVHIQFKDDTVSAQELQKAKREAADDLEHPFHHVADAGEPFSTAVWRLRQPNENHRVQRAWQAVQFRQVSVPEDETIVIANVLRLDVKQLETIGHDLEEAEVVAEKRMVKLLRMLDHQRGLGIPSGIIFTPGPRLTTDGYRWAPKTWLTEQERPYPLMRTLRQAGAIMQQGLLVEFPGLILHCPQVPPQTKVFWMPVQQSLHKWYKVIVEQGGVDQEFRDFWDEHIQEEKELSIIMSTLSPRERWEIGLLALTIGFLTRGEVRHVRSVSRVWVRLETNTNILRDLGDSFRSRPGKMILGERVKSQKWCVEGDFHR